MGSTREPERRPGFEHLGSTRSCFFITSREIHSSELAIQGFTHPVTFLSDRRDWLLRSSDRFVKDLSVGDFDTPKFRARSSWSTPSLELDSSNGREHDSSNARLPTTKQKKRHWP
jgi:hypothetical protein